MAVVLLTQELLCGASLLFFSGFPFWFASLLRDVGSLLKFLCLSVLICEARIPTRWLRREMKVCRHRLGNRYMFYFVKEWVYDT